MNAQVKPPVTAVYHVIKGEIFRGDSQHHGSTARPFTTPAIDLDSLVWSRREPGPMFDTPVADIMDILIQTGQRISRDPDGLLAQALEQSVATSPLPRDVLQRSYEHLGTLFNRASMQFQIDNELGGSDVLDGWREVVAPSGRRHRVRAFPPRLVHIVAGNAPGVSALSVIRGALVKGVNLLKLPSNDLFTATAILRAMAAVAPGHPINRSFSAAYWRGGDTVVESQVFRSQYFDKLVAWGGEGALKSAKQYVGPGFELVAFDPKTSISLLGREIFATDEALATAAERAAIDVTLMNQQACASSRFQYVEGSVEQIDRYCAALQGRLGVERATCSKTQAALPPDLREEIDGLRDMEPYYRVWGDHRGSGVVIRSEEPVEFQPDGRVVNVIPVDSIENAAAEHANVATQTVGVWPAARKQDLRNILAAAGVQRVVELGSAGSVETGLPHDGFLPLQRFVRWVNDEG